MTTSEIIKEPKDAKQASFPVFSTACVDKKTLSRMRWKPCVHHCDRYNVEERAVDVVVFSVARAYPVIVSGARVRLRGASLVRPSRYEKIHLVPASRTPATPGPEPFRILAQHQFSGGSRKIQEAQRVPVAGIGVRGPVGNELAFFLLSVLLQGFMGLVSPLAVGGREALSGVWWFSEGQGPAD